MPLESSHGTPSKPDSEACPADEDLPCPLCSYNLRGLSDPRCPECGYRFDWTALRESQRNCHPWLFEHHPEANIWSFWKTAVAGLRPRTFWRSVQPTHSIVPKRLIKYWLTSAILFATAVAADCVIEFVVRFAWAVTTTPGGPRWPTWLTLLSWYFTNLFAGEFLTWAVGPLAWTWFTLLVALAFRGSIRRARIRPVQLMRAFVYACDPVFWLMLTALAALTFALCASDPQMYGLIAWPLTIALFAVGGTFVMYRLHAALKLYLGFEHPILIITATQIIVALTFVNLYYLDYVGWHW